jgi:apolipoprotein D and lipocalin family protein
MKIPVLLLAIALITGCAASLPPLATVERVDIKRFMGTWYVIASIPTFIETDAFNAVESYRLDADGTIDTTFTFRKGTFDGPLKTYHPRGLSMPHPMPHGGCGSSGPSRPNT